MRSCYSANVAFWRDNPTELSKITWYFVDPSVGVIPYATPFSSRTWDILEGIVPELGERATPRPWSAGNPPWGGPPGAVCGSEDDWTNGALSSDPDPPVWPGTRVPLCCPQPGVVATPGEAYTAGIGTIGPTGCCDGVTLPALVTATCVDAGPGCACWLGLEVPCEPSFSGGWIAISRTVNPCFDSLGPWNFSIFCSILDDGSLTWKVGLLQGAFGWVTNEASLGTCDPFEVLVTCDPRPGTTCGPNTAQRLTWLITATP